MSVKNIQNFTSTFLASFIGVFCFAPKFSNLILAFFILFVFVLAIQKKIRFKWNLILILFISLYVLYFIGFFYGFDKSYSSKILEYKFSFLIFPALFSLNGKGFELYSIDKIKIGLIFGVAISSLVGIINSLQCYSVGGSFLCFLTTNISPIHHPSYYVVFHLFAILFVWQGYLKKFKFFTLKWIIPFSLISICIQFLCLSLAGLLFFFALAIIYILYQIKIKLGKIYFTISIVVIPVLVSIVFFSIPQFEGEFNGAFKFVRGYISSPSKFVKSREISMSGSEERLVMWTVSFQECLEHPIGVGTGNVDYFLNRRLVSYGQIKLAHKNYNPHNQFFQISLEIGILGLSIFLLLLFFTLKKALNLKEVVLGVLVCNLLFNCLFESMLQRQSGIVFYTFWICLLISPEVSRFNRLKE
jgi:O-antigen ligase